MDSPEPNKEKLEAFTQALRKAEARRSVFIPPTLDERVLRHAERHFTGPQAVAWPGRLILNLFSRPRRRLAALWLLLAVLVPLLFVISRDPATKFAQQDINRDGQVDILDAMALAKMGDSTSNAVNAIALSAVRLNPPPRS